jgi:hypothetical protein
MAGLGTLAGKTELGDAAGRIGNSQTWQQAGEHVQAHAQEFLAKGLPEAEAQAWAPVDAAMTPKPGAAPPQVALSNTEATLKSLTKEGAGDAREAALAKVTQPGIASRLLSALRGEPGGDTSFQFLRPPPVRAPEAPPEANIPRAPSVRPEAGGPTPALPGGLRPINTPAPSAASVPSATLRPINTPAAPSGSAPSVTLRPIKAQGPGAVAPLPWDTVRELRSTIGDAMTNSASPLFKDLGQQNLSKIYSGLTQDLQATAQANGAGEAFAAANATSSQLRTLAEQHVKPLVDPGVTPGVAATRAMKDSTRDATRLTALRSVMPDAVNELTSAHLLQTPKGWLKLSAEARAAMVPDPIQRLRIDNAVARATGAPNQLTSSVEGLRESALGEMGGAALSGLFHGDEIFGGATGGLVGMGLRPALRGVNAIMQNPDLVRAPLVGAVAGGQ